MRRVILTAVVVASSLAMSGSADARCTADHRGGSAGPYDTAGVTYGGLDITAWTYGNFATGPAYVCSDGTSGADAPYGDFEVKRDGEVVCTSTDPGFRMTSDPFGFGASINGTGEDCAVRISFDGIMATPGASPDDVAADAAGANAGVRKDAPVKEFGEGGTDPSTVTLGSETIEIPNGTMGFFSKGTRVQSEH